MKVFVWVFFCFFTAIAVAKGEQAAMQDVRQRLEGDFFRELYAHSYNSLIERVEPDGFFQESLTGAYPGMFCRTVGALVSLFVETGQLQFAQQVIDCSLNAMTSSDMERIPHIFGRSCTVLEPVAAQGQIVQAASSVPLFRLDNGYCAGQVFTAPLEPLMAVEAYVDRGDCEGDFLMAIYEQPDEKPLAVVRKKASQLGGNPWLRMELPCPLVLTAQQKYWLVLSFEGRGIPVWKGLAQVASHPLAGVIVRDAGGEPQPGPWRQEPYCVMAFALDTGFLEHRVCEHVYPIISRMDQIDGQAHVIMAWARLALARGEMTPFEERTWPVVAKLVDRMVDWPYMAGPNGNICHLGLVHNFCFEHSREGRYWDTYDILTQSFAGAALEEMIKVARRRGQREVAEYWTERLEGLKGAIDKFMTRQVEGRKIYLEMRLPNGYDGLALEVMGWVNLAPVAAQWEALDHQVLVDTVKALRARNLNSWRQYKWLGSDWTPGTGSSAQVIGKAVGWELDYSRRQGEWNRILEWMDFIEAVHQGTGIYMEAANYNRQKDCWTLQDPGNGEQTAWWCWAMARLRKQAGVSAQP